MITIYDMLFISIVVHFLQPIDKINISLQTFCEQSFIGIIILIWIAVNITAIVAGLTCSSNSWICLLRSRISSSKVPEKDQMKFSRDRLHFPSSKRYIDPSIHNARILSRNSSILSNASTLRGLYALSRCRSQKIIIYYKYSKNKDSLTS